MHYHDDSMFITKGWNSSGVTDRWLVLFSEETKSLFSSLAAAEKNLEKSSFHHIFV